MKFTVLNRWYRVAMVISSMSTSSIVVVRPATQDVFRHSTLQQELAWRVLFAIKEGAKRRAQICTSRELRKLAPEELRDAELIMVGPSECIDTSGDRSSFVSAFASARRRLLASAEPVGSPWYLRQFRSALKFDAVLDLGFVSQQEKHRLGEVAYHFVFNGPMSGEVRAIYELTPPTERPIKWTLVGYPTARRLEQAAQLTEELDPGGFVFMPGQPSRVSPDGSPKWPQPLVRHEKISPSGLAALLSKSSYYVWSSAHDLAYYESFRFIAAVRSGTVPCKIGDIATLQDLSEIPGIFPSVADLCSAVRKEGAPSMYRRARDFYLSKGPLATHLEEALAHV